MPEPLVHQLQRNVDHDGRDEEVRRQRDLLQREAQSRKRNHLEKSDAKRWSRLTVEE